MTMLQQLKRLVFKNRPKKAQKEFVQVRVNNVAVPEWPPAPVVEPPAIDALPNDDVDFAPQSDLEAYAKGLNVPKETIERWISAGLLFPDEIKVAEKILRILRIQDRQHAA